MPRRPALLDNGRAKALGACSRCGRESGGGHRKKYLVKLTDTQKEITSQID